jgi:hypothetical protein
MNDLECPNCTNNSAFKLSTRYIAESFEEVSNHRFSML